MRRPRRPPPPLHEPLESAAAVSLVHRCQAGTLVGGWPEQALREDAWDERVRGAPGTAPDHSRAAEKRKLAKYAVAKHWDGGPRWPRPYKQLTPFRKPEEQCAKENTYPMGPRTQELHFQGPFDTEGSIFTKTCVRICDAA